VTDPHSADYPETPLGVRRCECGARVYSNEADGRCATCGQFEPVEHTPELLRGWAATLREVIAGGEWSLTVRQLAEAKATEWKREADELERAARGDVA
jgi:predicted ATP-dependent serine protease